MHINTSANKIFNSYVYATKSAVKNTDNLSDRPTAVHLSDSE